MQKGLTRKIAYKPLLATNIKTLLVAIKTFYTHIHIIRCLKQIVKKDNNVNLTCNHNEPTLKSAHQPGQVEELVLWRVAMLASQPNRQPDEWKLATAVSATGIGMQSERQKYSHHQASTLA